MSFVDKIRYGYWLIFVNFFKKKIAMIYLVVSVGDEIVFIYIVFK